MGWGDGTTKAINSQARAPEHMSFDIECGDIRRRVAAWPELRSNPLAQAATIPHSLDWRITAAKTAPKAFVANDPIR